MAREDLRTYSINPDVANTFRKICQQRNENMSLLLENFMKNYNELYSSVLLAIPPGKEKISEQQNDDTVVNILQY